VFDEAERQTPPRDELIAAVETEKSVEPSAALAGADRRTHPRYEFTAAVEVVAPESGARIETRVRDLSQQGAYVDTNNPLPLGTVTDVRITKGAQLFEAWQESSTPESARAWGWCLPPLSRSSFGLLKRGLPNPRDLLARGKPPKESASIDDNPSASLGEDRRRIAFGEETHTRAISAHGALIPCPRRCTEDSGSLCRTSRQERHWSVLSHT